MSTTGYLFCRLLKQTDKFSNSVRLGVSAFGTRKSPDPDSDGDRSGLLRRKEVKALMEAFQFSASRAALFLKKYPALTGRVAELSGAIVSLKGCGLRPEDLAANTHLLTASKHELEERIKLLRQLRVTNFEVLPELLNLPMEETKRCLELIKKSGSKIKQFADLLGCSEIESVRLYLKYSILARSKPTTLKTKIDTLIEGGISRDDLIRDLWILTYTTDRLKERLKKASEMNMTPLKPWMLRCNEKIIYRSWINKEVNRAAMAPLSSSKEYLCQRLDMTQDEMKVFASKHPPVMRVQVAKLKEIIDFLLAEGFTQTQIYNTPRILCHSLTTIQERLSLLREKKYEPYTLSLLCKSERNFTEFLHKLSALLNMQKENPLA